MTNTQEIKSIIFQSFKDLFEKTYQVKLVDEGASEPLYLPADQDSQWNRIVVAHGFWTSALHEISHWCIAGERRRTMVDYGYWYEPEGRTSDQQKQFQAVEAKPQALEWLLTSSLGQPFYMSFDSAGAVPDSLRESFSEAVTEQALSYINNGIPKRAGMLCEKFQTKLRTRDSFLAYWKDVEIGHVRPK